MSDDVLLKKADLTRFAAAIFAAAGVEPAMAATWAEAVVWANLRGVDSHGVIRIPRYVDLLKKKAVNARPQMKIERRSGAIAVLEADRAPGAIAMTRAMDEAIARAREVPVGWGIDAEGRDTTDPKKIATLLPLGGAKGSGLSVMIECLASLAVGNPLISLALLSGGLAESPFLNGVAIAVDLAAVGDLDAFTSEVDRLGDAIVGLPRAAGVDRILLPGERGDAVLAEREASGIPIPKGTWTRLVAAAKALG